MRSIGARNRKVPRERREREKHIQKCFRQVQDEKDGYLSLMT